MAFALPAGVFWAMRGTDSPRQIDFSFDSGSMPSGFSAYRGATVGADYAHDGAYGCRLAPTTATKKLAYLEILNSGFEPDQPWATFAMWFRLVTAPKASDTYMNLFEIGNSLSGGGAKSQFTVYFRRNRLVADFNTSELLDLGPVPATGIWHRIQVKVFFGSTRYTADIRYDGTTHTLVSAKNKTPATVRALWIHYPGTAVDYTMDVDEIRMSTAADEPDFL